MSEASRQKRKLPLVLWGGFIDGKLHTPVEYAPGYECWRHCPALFTSRRDAKREYEDVRRVILTAGGDRE